MRKFIIILAALAIGVPLAWVGYEHWDAVKAAEPPDRAAPAPSVPVTAGVAETRDMPVYVRGMGTVQAYNAVTVKSRVDGQIVKVDFTEGQEVKAGDPLFEIDPRPFDAALAQARANKEKDEAQLGSAQADLQRFERLVGNGYQTRQSYDQQKGLVGQLQAAVKADQAQIEMAQLNLQYATIRSPIDGRTGARLVDVGNLVRAADNGGLVTITQLRPIFVSFTVPQGELDRVRRHQSEAPLAVQALGQSDERLLATGRLTLIDNQIDQTTGTIHLKAVFDNRDEALWPGAFVDVRLVVSVRKDAVTVAARAVQRGPRGDYVFVIGPDMTVETRIVEVAEAEDGLAVIDKGLAAGERVVVDGQYRLEQGTKVAVQPPAGREGG
jgi:multidrug efflux system membrane fusion protein